MMRKYFIVYLLSTLLYSFVDDTSWAFNMQLFLFGQPVFLLLLVIPMICYEYLRQRTYAKNRRVSSLLLCILVCYITGIGLYYFQSLFGLTSFENNSVAAFRSPILFCVILLLIFETVSKVLLKEEK
jgi:uncharacterized membrane protein